MACDHQKRNQLVIYVMSQLMELLRQSAAETKVTLINRIQTEPAV
jgi:hypothetical protein